MDQFIEGKNPYEILELENGQKSTLDEIKKAYRRLALVKHPDKAKGDKAAAAQEFDELKKAYAILCDKAARGALDDYLEAQAHREKRLAQQDAKRQKLRQELEKKEREGERTRNEEEQARARLKVELEALRARAQQEQRDKQQQQQAAAAAAARAASSASAGPSGRPPAAAAVDDDETTELLKRTVKVTWDPTVGGYTTDRLRDLFGQKFIVEDVILKDSRKKKKASALVVLDSIQAAVQAAHEVLGDLKNPLLVTPYLKVMPEADHQQQQQGSPGGSTAAAAAAAGADGRRRPAAPLFAAGGAGAASGARPVQRPSKPLFPSAQPPAAAAAVAAAADADGTAGDAAGTSNGTAAASTTAAAAAGGSKPKSFNSFPGMPPAAGGSKGFSSFPGMPTGGFEQSVLQKLQQKGQNKQQ